MMTREREEKGTTNSVPKKITTAKVTSANESSLVRDLADIPKANSFILSRTFSP
mgnify:CR=1 FL=1